MKTNKFLTGMSAMALAAIMLGCVTASADKAEDKTPEPVESSSAAEESSSSEASSEASSEDPSSVMSEIADGPESMGGSTDSTSSVAEVKHTEPGEPTGGSTETAKPEEATPAKAEDKKAAAKKAFTSVTESDELKSVTTTEKGSSIVVVPADKVKDLPEGEKVGVVVDYETLESYFDPDAKGTAKAEALKKANIAFVIDTTGSMNSYIKNVKTNLSDFVKGLKDKGVEPSMSVIEYRDITTKDGAGTTKFHTIGGEKWSSDVDAVVAEFDKLTVNGGGDTPETTLDAFDKLFEEDPTWYKKEGSDFIFILTDAPTKEGAKASTNGRSMADWTDILAKDGIEVSIVGEKSDKESYKDLVEKTGGKYLDISSKDYSDLMLSYATNIRERVDHTVPYKDHTITLADLKEYTTTKEGAGTVTFILTPDEAKKLMGADAKNADLSKYTFKLHGMDVVKVTITTETDDLKETEGVKAPSTTGKKADANKNPETGSKASGLAVAAIALAAAVVTSKKLKK